MPLHGHTLGHCAVAVRDRDRWLLHCGDAFFHRNTLRGQRPPLALAWFERRVETLAEPRRRNAARLAELAQTHGDDVTMFNAHDPMLFDRARIASDEAGTLR